MRGQRACLFQHIFSGRFYGYDCHLDTATDRWMLEEVEAPLPRLRLRKPGETKED